MLGVLEGLLSANLRPFAATVAAGPPASAASEATYSFIQVRPPRYRSPRCHALWAEYREMNFPDDEGGVVLVTRHDSGCDLDFDDDDDDGV